jgi:hypothetical protein
MPITNIIDVQAGAEHATAFCVHFEEPFLYFGDIIKMACTK